MEILYTVNSPGLDRFSEQRCGQVSGQMYRRGRDLWIRDNTDADSGDCKHGDNAQIRCNPGLSNSVLSDEV